MRSLRGMYRYDETDQQLVNERVAQFRDQTRRYLAGELDEEQFKHLRLRNGLYIQRHAPMLRVAIPYGLLSSVQLRKLAHIARRYDRGYGHFTTRQNIQFNWPRLEDVPEILAELATVQMHAIQTSGNCIRNITTDHFAGIAPDEVVDPFVWCELIRQWSTLHPEFSWLPRKFKIAVSGSAADRAAILVHDIGLAATRDDAGEVGFRVAVGGGLGRTPIVGHVIREFLPWRHLLSYLEAILRVYNRHGRRDNIYKARIKILVKALGPEAFAREVEAEWAHLKDGPATLTEADIERIQSRFSKPGTDPDLRPEDAEFTLKKVRSVPGFARWERRNVHPHKRPGYCAVTLSLKKTRRAAGRRERRADGRDRRSRRALQLRRAARLPRAEPGVRRRRAARPARAVAGAARGGPRHAQHRPADQHHLLPGRRLLLARQRASSIPVAEAIQRRFDDLDYLFDIGELDLNISGCMNACGHHHIGHIGILGVDKHGEEFYQLEIGGSQGAQAALGRVLGPALRAAEVPDAIERLIEVYLERRDSEAERFVDVVRRIGIEPFKENVYAKDHQEPQDHRGRLAAA